MIYPERHFHGARFCAVKFAYLQAGKWGVFVLGDKQTLQRAPTSSFSGAFRSQCRRDHGRDADRNLENLHTQVHHRQSRPRSSWGTRPRCSAVLQRGSAPGQAGPAELGVQASPVQAWVPGLLALAPRQGQPPRM